MPKKSSTECTNHPPIRLCYVLYVLRDIRGTFKFLPEQYILRCTFFLISWHPNLFSSNMHIVLIFTGPKTQCNKMWHSKRRYTTAFYLVMLIIVFAVAVAVSPRVPYPAFFYLPRLLHCIHLILIDLFESASNLIYSDKKCLDDVWWQCMQCFMIT